MTPESAVKKLLAFAGQAVLLDIDELRRMIEERERMLPAPNDLGYAIALADLEMARTVLVYTGAYHDLMIAVTHDYRRRIVHVDAVEIADAVKRNG